MLVIRDAQMKVLAEPMDTRFFRALVRWMRSAWWEQTLGRPDQDLEREVRALAAHAASFGVRREDDVKAFVDLELRLGPGFEHKLSCAPSILGDATLSGEAKMALLRQRTEAR